MKDLPPNYILDKYWQDAIKFIWNNECTFSSESSCKGMLKAWHIVKCKHPQLRWLIENGVLLCKKHRKLLHTTKASQIIKQLIGPHIMRHLKIAEKMTFIDYLQKRGLTRNEYKIEQLQRMTNNPHSYIRIGRLWGPL